MFKPGDIVKLNRAAMETRYSEMQINDFFSSYGINYNFTAQILSFDPGYSGVCRVKFQNTISSIVSLDIRILELEKKYSSHRLTKIFQ